MKKNSFVFVFMAAFLPVLVLFSASTSAADNELTPNEKSEGWLLLFNGKDYTGWKNNNNKPINSKVEDGCIQTYKCGGYILTYDKEFSNFILKCDIKMSNPCNSGIFVRMENLKDTVNTSFEIQVATAAANEKPNVHSVGALYDVKPPTKIATNGPEKWDHYEVKFAGDKLTVFLNNTEIITANLQDYKEPGKRDVAGKHKFTKNGKARALTDFAKKGYIGFQNHDHKVWIKNVKLLEIDENGNKLK
ncbi:MAG: DUF1080 domain-containing protein [Planctomycetaceae bacterium]|jgi:hypothetical protein|nr:DUF1080 domain-containing protein [Planctomycetaceae bacterium]